MEDIWPQDDGDPNEDSLGDALGKVARAMAVSTEDARYIFESVGPDNADEIIKGLMIDPETERIIEEAKRTDRHWWQRRFRLPR